MVNNQTYAARLKELETEIERARQEKQPNLEAKDKAHPPRNREAQDRAFLASATQIAVLEKEQAGTKHLNSILMDKVKALKTVVCSAGHSPIEEARRASREPVWPDVLKGWEVCCETLTRELETVETQWTVAQSGRTH